MIFYSHVVIVYIKLLCSSISGFILCDKVMSLAKASLATMLCISLVVIAVVVVVVVVVAAAAAAAAAVAAAAAACTITNSYLFFLHCF